MHTDTGTETVANTVKIATPGDREIVITRSFAAPRELVFEAMTRPDLLMRWLSGPPEWSMVECESEPEVGGAFRHLWRSAEGAEMSMHGVYRELVRPERIVRTESFETGCEPQGGEQLATMVLSETDGGAGTALRLTVLYPSQEARDGAIASGMERGVAAGYDHLDELLAGLAQDRAR